MASLTKEYSKEKLTGQIYTPDFIVEKILNDIEYRSDKILGKTILDPACGDGRFLVKIAERIIQFSEPEDLPENLCKIYAWDIDPDALKIARNKLNELIKPLNLKINWNLYCTNALHKALDRKPEPFDYIVGNPPYIRIQHLKEEERTFIRNNYNFCKSGNTDIYIAFYELALHLLKNTGTCGFITPNTFFHTETAKFIRNYFAEKQNIVQITNYGSIQLFENATTYSAIVIFDKKSRADFLFQSAKNQMQFRQRQIKFSELRNKKFWQLAIDKKNNNKG
ncbi:MAG: SAM-dependent methyltransferase, partial [Bacteroidales bacterium]|nr:SAM-dependent methyltransferase [Bacteroidales bacterium]